MTPTRTAIEVASDGTPLRVFHRRGSSAWTHPLDNPTYLTHGRHDARGIRPCPICTPRMDDDAGRVLGPREPAQTTFGDQPGDPGASSASGAVRRTRRASMR
jgi:hypothetical protein